MTKVTQLTLDADGGLGRRRIHLREISGDSDTPLETVGQDLRTARLRRGDDLATVSRALKIRKDHLEALEEDHLDALPGKTYAVGFVRSYAAFLGLDPVQCVERFKAEIGGRPDESSLAPAILDHDEHRRLPQGWRIIAAFVVVMVFYGIYHLWSSSNRPAATPVPPPPARLQPAPVAPSAGNAGDNAALAPAPMAPAQTATTPPPQSAASKPAPPSAAARAITAPTAFGAQPQSGAPQPAVPDRQASTGHAYGSQNRDARVVLRARGDTHVLVRGPDGMVYINRDLSAGDSYRVPNIVGITLATTDAGAVEVDLDGVAMGMAGRDLQTTGDLSLDPQAIVDHYNKGGAG